MNTNETKNDALSIYSELVSQGYKSAEPLFQLTENNKQVIAFHKFERPDSFPDVIYDFTHDKAEILKIIGEVLAGSVVILTEEGNYGQLGDIDKIQISRKLPGLISKQNKRFPTMSTSRSQKQKIHVLKVK